ncbi:MAG: DUF4255 domain-containing protein [Bacteroidota bacterium]
MIFEAIEIIRTELAAKAGITVGIGNISEIINDTAHHHAGDVVISLINIEENRISRDPSNYLKKDGGILMKNPAVHLNLSLLFTSVRNNSAYGKSLKDLQEVIGAFQAKNVFDHSNTPTLSPKIEKLILDMVSLNLQQLHEIWSVLGGRYYPSVVYRMRMVTIDSVTTLHGDLVKEIDLNFINQ